jgi:hypothetical protein
MRHNLLLLFGLLAALLALPAQTPQDIGGKWHFVLDTEGGPREADAEFSVEAGIVKGKWAETPVEGTYKDGQLDLSFKFTSPEAGEGTLKISGKLDGDVLKGNWAFEQYSGTFAAKRP